MKITKVMNYLLSIVVLISIAIGVNGCMSEQDEILEYLEEKYGEKFEVERYWSENNGSSYLSHKMIVYPVDYPELFFKAGKYRDSVKQKDILWDSYIPAQWSMAYTYQHQKEIATIVDTDVAIKYRITIPKQLESKYSNVSLEEYLRKNSRNDYGPTAIVGIAVKADKLPNKPEEAKLVYRIYQKLQENNFRNFSIHVVYAKSEAFNQVKELMAMYHADSQISVDTIGPQNYYLNVLIDKQDKVKSSEDIAALFQNGE